MRTTLVGATIKYSTNAWLGRLARCSEHILRYISYIMQWAALRADRYTLSLCSLDVKVYQKVALRVEDCPAVSFRFVYLQQINIQM